MEDVSSKPKQRKKAGADDGQEPVHTISVGTLTASVYLRQAPSGYAYFAYNIRRSYQSLTTSNQAYSTDFFAENKSVLLAVIEEASIRMFNESERARDTFQNAA